MFKAAMVLMMIISMFCLFSNWQETKPDHADFPSYGYQENVEANGVLKVRI